MELAAFMLDKFQNPRTRALLAMSTSLLGIYEAFSTGPFDPSIMIARARSFSLQYRALGQAARDADQKLWVCKPKFHLLSELEYLSVDIGNPSLFWCYKDEDFVGFVSNLARSRGGGRTAGTTPLRVLERWRALCR